MAPSTVLCSEARPGSRVVGCSVASTPSESSQNPFPDRIRKHRWAGADFQPFPVLGEGQWRKLRQRVGRALLIRSLSDAGLIRAHCPKALLWAWRGGRGGGGRERDSCRQKGAACSKAPCTSLRERGSSVQGRAFPTVTLSREGSATLTARSGKTLSAPPSPARDS